MSPCVRRYAWSSSLWSLSLSDCYWRPSGRIMPAVNSLFSLIQCGVISGFLKILEGGWSIWARCQSYPITALRCMWIIHSNFNDSLLLRECLSSHTFKVSVKFPGTLVYQSIRESCHSWHPRNLPLICMVISNIQACYRPHYITLFQWFIPVI